ncbi:MAG TPA: glycosyltransferase family 2 protein [Thermoleophilaceae bacterium]|jgi:hypothetical protein
MRRTLDTILALPAAVLALANGYLLVLLAAAVRPSRPGRAGAPMRFVVLIPAHDEEEVIAPTVAATVALGAEAIVVADNCSDATAERAAGAGATVWERDDPERPGKGEALEWALERVLRERAGSDGVVLLDADCHPSPNLLEACGRRMRAGAGAVQAAYRVADPGASPAAALRWAGFALMNDVRPRGKTSLGLSCGLFGSGMAFSLDLLRRVPWRAHGLTEDAEQHLRLVAAGERVVFAPEASVESPMPASFAASESQQQRWEAGRLATGRRGAAVAARGLRAGDPRRVHAGLEPLLPPQSVLAAGSLALGALAGALRLPRTARLAAASLTAQAAYVLGGLALVRAPAPVWRALLSAPLLVTFKLRVYAQALAGRGPSAWVRTPR